MGYGGLVTIADLLLHPVRLRVLQAFLGGRELTTAQLAVELSDLPSGGLYRHVSLLAAGGVLTVVSERRVRGAVERTYALRLERSHLGPADLATFTRDDHAQAFATFVAALLSEYNRYLAEPETEPVRDGVSYSMNALWLDDEEYGQFLRDVGLLIQPRMAFTPGQGRKRRLVASAFLPLARSRAEGGAGDD